MQEQVEDQGLAGLARSRPAATRPTASADHTILAPVPAPLDCPYLHLDDDGPGCLALAPAIRLSRRQVELVCAVAAHVSCPRLIRADAGRAPARIEPPAAIRRRDRPPIEATETTGLSAAAAAATTTTHEPAVAAATTTREPTAAGRPAARTPAPAVSRTTKPKPTAISAAPSRIAVALASVRAGAREHVVIRPATVVAWVVLVATLVIVIALLSARGGLNLPAASSSAGVVLASPSPASPSATPFATPSATPSPSVSPSPSASSPPSPSPSASPAFPPDRLALLTPCPGGPAGCYQYKIKANDNLRNLATFFGVAYPALLAANPQIKNPSLIHVGEVITIPIPAP